MRELAQEAAADPRAPLPGENMPLRQLIFAKGTTVMYFGVDPVHSLTGETSCPRDGSAVCAHDESRDSAASSTPATMRWTVAAAGNDASCGPAPRTAGRFAPPRWEILFESGDGYVASPDEPMFGWSTSYEVFQAARQRRAVVVAAFLRAAARAVRESIRGVWERYQRRQHSRSIYHALHVLDDRTLRDLGFHRCEIGSVAAEAAGEAEHTRMHVRRGSRAPS
jgi:uncharacterized protein YjiS (DUF1127 family)